MEHGAGQGDDIVGGLKQHEVRQVPGKLGPMKQGKVREEEWEGTKESFTLPRV